MTPEELAALHALSFTMPRPWSAAEFAAFLSDPAAFLLTEGAAFLLARVTLDEAELLTLAVPPDDRGRGLGAGLVARFLHEAKARGAATAFLEVAEDNAPACALYAKTGFAEAGLRRGYYRSPEGKPVNARVMMRAL